MNEIQTREGQLRDLAINVCDSDGLYSGVLVADTISNEVDIPDEAVELINSSDGEVYFFLSTAGDPQKDPSIPNGSLSATPATERLPNALLLTKGTSRIICFISPTTMNFAFQFRK